MKRSKLFIVALLASSLVLSACDLNFSFSDETNNNQQQPSEQTVSLTKIAVSKQPTKLIYEINESFESAGLEVTATYSDNSTKDVTSSVTLSTVDTSTSGKKDVQVSYTENNKTVSTSFSITVNAPKVYYTISFDANGGTGTMNPLQVEKGKKFTLPGCEFTAPNNKSFKAWKIGYSEYAVGSEIMATGNMTITAVWQDDGVAPIQTYTVSFDANGGSGTMANQTVNAGSTFTLPACSFTGPNNYTFKAWLVGTDTTERAVGYQFTVNSNVTVSAVWQDNTPVTQYTMTFDKNGGSGSMSSITVNAGTSIVLPECTFTAPTGKIFDGWAINNVKFNVGVSYSMNANVTAKAQWANDPNAEYTVTFDKNGGTGSMDSMTVKNGTQITLPANGFTAPANKQFKNWLIGSTTYNVGATYTVTGNVTIRANWEYIKRTITFNANGGSGTMSAVQVNSGSNYTLPSCSFTAPTNKKFKAWQIGSTEYAAGDSVTVTSDITVTALWKDKPANAAWTIMLYISGNDLESGNDGNGNYNTSGAGYATKDIAEILSVSNQPDDVNIIIETGGAGAWRSTYGISSSKIGRYYVQNKQLKQDPTNSSLGNDNMGSSSTFQSFLEWGLTNYPAEKTGVILWNHGGAMKGVCYDEKHGDDPLTDNEVVTALSGAFSSLGRTDKLEFIGYDACLMQVQDIAEFNAPYFNYMVGSEESEAGEGWDYDTWIDDVYAGNSTKTILSAICDGFIAAYNTNYPGYDNDQTLSVLDLSKVDAYKTAFESLANEIKTKYNNSSSNKTAFENILSNTKNYADIYCNYQSYQQYVNYYGYESSWFTYTGGYYVCHGYHLYGTFDVTDFLNKLSSNSTYKTCSSLSTAKTALGELIIKNSKGDEAGESYGLCMVAPMNNLVDYNYSSTTTHFTNWRTFINSSSRLNSL